MGYEVVNLKKTPSAELLVPNGRVFNTLESYELVEKADAVISVPKLKIHDQI